MKLSVAIIAVAFAAVLLLSGCTAPPTPKENGFCSKDADCQYYWFAGGCYTPENMKKIQDGIKQTGAYPANAQEIPGAGCSCQANACKMIVPPVNLTPPSPPAEEMTKWLCESARGSWNECASACRDPLLDQPCTLQCVQQCECGGIEGRGCPQGYACEATSSSDDILFGVCKPIAPAPKACSADAKVCPDGSVVGRTGPACEFAPCPAQADEMTKWLCESARGNWNECASACRGAPEGTACTLQCVPQCECGGIAGFGCPAEYHCSDYLPVGAADAMGVCKKNLYQ